MLTNKSKKEILEELKPLFIEAREKNLWFYCGYQCIWFSPDELKAEHDKGMIIWGPVNWKLRNPKEELGNLVENVNRAKQAVISFKERLIYENPLIKL